MSQVIVTPYLYCGDPDVMHDGCTLEEGCGSLVEVLRDAPFANRAEAQDAMNLLRAGISAYNQQNNEQGVELPPLVVRFEVVESD